MENIMYFRNNLHAIHRERNNAKKAVDSRSLDELEFALKNMSAFITDSLQEVERQKYGSSEKSWYDE